MKTVKGIYCIEGTWDGADIHNNISVRPMFDLLKGAGYCKYVYRNCATIDEFSFFVKELAHKKNLKNYPILYFAFHGCRDAIKLADKKTATLTYIAKLLEGKCKGCIVFFASCNTGRC